MTQTKLLVIYGSEHSDTEHRVFMSAITALTYLADVHLIVVREGQSADAVLERCALADRDACDPAANIKAGLRRGSEARKDYWAHQLSTGAITLDQLGEDIAKLRTEVELARKRGDDTSALLYKWDRAGVPSASEPSGLKILHKVEATTAQLRDELANPVTAIQGEAMSFMLDPLEQAIELIVRLVDERLAAGHPSSLNISAMLVGHLEDLLAEQLKRVTSDE